MPIPDGSRKILEQYESRRIKTGLFQGQRDYQAQMRWTHELVKRMGTSVHLFPSSSSIEPRGKLESAGVDKLYGDIIDPEFIDDPKQLDQRRLNMRALVDHQPSKQLLKKYGIDETKDVIFYFTLLSLQEKNLIDEGRFRGIGIGDLIFWDGTWYIVRTSTRDAYFGSTTNPFFVTIMCDRYRHNTVPTDDRPICTLGEYE